VTNARLIEEAGAQALALACDATSEDDVQSALDTPIPVAPPHLCTRMETTT
jgi:hypothetical protein